MLSVHKCSLTVQWILSMFCMTFPSFRKSGIQYRKDESVGGWFSQIGEMHQVHHLWGKLDFLLHDALP